MTTKVVLCCAVCNQAISGQYTTADGFSYHGKCFKYCMCGAAVAGQYVREGGRIYCPADIPMTNSMICARCNEPIELGTNYLEFRDQSLHRECFTCVDCGRPLDGSRFFVRKGENGAD